MREIKFRGLPTCKDKDELDYINFDRDGNFAVGFYEDGYIIGKVADANDEYISPEFWVAVDRNTVGQYTGLHDKNGREIYENDIVKMHQAVLSPDDKIGWVEYTAQYGYSIRFGNRRCRQSDWANDEGAKYEVIGNIYENPELMEEEE